MPGPHHVFFTRPADEDVPKEFRTQLRVPLQVHYEPDFPPPERSCCARLVRLVRLVTDRIDAEVLDAAGPQLKVVANMAVAYDHIDITAAAQRGVTVTNTPGVLERVGG